MTPYLWPKLRNLWLNLHKAAGLNGVPPGLCKLLPPPWIIFISKSLCIIFTKSLFPVEWTLVKLIILFKKGCPSMCGNYWGICITDFLFKVYDRTLLNRLNMWYALLREQAGCQNKRDCLEHILTVRLLCDDVKKTRVQLFFMFIDFEKAYDKIPRLKLFQELKLLGYSGKLLSIITAMYRSTTFFI